MTLSLSGACKWCGENPGTGRPECNRCRRIWLAGYEEARKQAVTNCRNVPTRTKDMFSRFQRSVEAVLEDAEDRILAMQPEKP